MDSSTSECSYLPNHDGQYKISVEYGGQQISQSPFIVDIKPKKESKIRAFGPGLEEGFVGYPACFTVETNGETGTLGKSLISVGLSNKESLLLFIHFNI